MEEAPQELLGGRYRLGRELGHGGAGVVYEATDERLGRRVAVKVLKSELSTPDLIQRFQAEAVAAASIGHAGIIQVSDFEAPANGVAYLVMEYLDGMPFNTLVANRAPLPEARVAYIAEQMLSALGAAHRVGIVHRDIKPANVFLTSVGGIRDVVKLLDFGVAKLTDFDDERVGRLADTMHGLAVGTPAYMAPEQARGQPVSPQTDIYAVGATMYEALSGRRPFSGASFNGLLAAIMETDPPPLTSLVDGLTPELVGIVEHAMAKRPEDRFRSADEMARALKGFAEPTRRATSAMTSQGGVPLPAGMPTATGSVDPARTAAAKSNASAAPVTAPQAPRPVAVPQTAMKAHTPISTASTAPGPAPSSIHGSAASHAVPTSQTGSRGWIWAVAGGGVVALAVLSAVGVNTVLSSSEQPGDEPPDPAPTEPTISPVTPIAPSPVAMQPMQPVVDDQQTVEPSQDPPPTTAPTNDGPTQTAAANPSAAVQERGPRSGPASDRERAVVGRVAGYVRDNCVTELPHDVDHVRFTAIVTVGPDGRQRSSRFSPQPPGGVAYCFNMHSMGTSWEATGSTRTIRVPISISR